MRLLLIISSLFIFVLSYSQKGKVHIRVPKGIEVVIDSSEVDTPITVLPVVKIDDFKLASDTDYLPAWKKAKAAIPSGGTILFGEGTYQINSYDNYAAGWYLEKDNLTIKGAGIDKTIITAAPWVGCTMSNYTRLAMPFLRGFMISDSVFTFTYKNSLKKGDSYIVLKSAKYTDSVKVGSKMMLVGGAHYFDQEFGELVTVTGKANDTLFLKDPLSGSYAVDSVPYASRTTNEFSMPEIGDTVSITTDLYYNVSTGRVISIGDNIFGLLKVVDSTKTMLLRNIGKGNIIPGSVIPAGTIVTKGRIIALWDHTKTLKIQDLTISGQQDRVLRLDNTYGAELSNVKIIRSSSVHAGFVYTIDFCRDIKFINCQVGSPGINSVSQISRSSGDISFKNCTFTKIKTDCSEYSFNVSFDSCIFNLKNDAFIHGNTVRKSYIINNIFNLDSSSGVFSTGEIQNLNRVQREYALIKGNTFNITNYCGTLLDLPVYGRSDFIDNKIIGGSMEMISNCLHRIDNGSGFYATDNRIENNYIETNFKRWFDVGGLYSGVINGNTVVNTSGVKVPVFINWNNLKSATVSNNVFTGFKSPITAPAGVILLNNTIQ